MIDKVVGDSLAADVKRIFLEALEVTDEAGRAEFVARECRDHEGLKERVISLLNAHCQCGQFLGGEEPAHESATRGEFLGGDLIDHYTLVEAIGEGGFGIVYLAEQHAPIRREVALKVLKPGMDSRQVLARFAAEEQALALMDHPHIARVYDAGLTPSGRPYFAMELVRGVPITTFCREQRLNWVDGLLLFVDVCRAVHHAHQKGVIHRDLKPTNVLVSGTRSAPAVKIIDFGVAKALGIQLTEQSLAASNLMMIGTPTYMSPEQSLIGNPDIDTRSDVYSLGVLLYEMLTGTVPLGWERLKELSWEELGRAIREQDPPPPSQSRQVLSKPLMHDRVSPGGLLDGLVGLRYRELDWITMKALEKDRGRRYDSAAALADDIGRFMVDEPVRASPPSLVYRAHKFAKRNRLALFVAAALGLVLSGSAVVLSISAARARSAEAIARQHLADEQAARRLADDARREADQQRQTAQHQRARAEWNLEHARAALDEMVGLLQHTEADDESRSGKLRQEVWLTALSFYQRFLEFNQGDDDLLIDVTRAHLRTSELYYSLGQMDQAESSARQAIQILLSEYRGEALNESLDVLLIEARLKLATVLLKAQHHPAETDALFQESLTSLERLSPAREPHRSLALKLVQGYHDYGYFLAFNGRRQAAEQYFLRAASLQRAQLALPESTGKDRQLLAMILNSLGIVTRQMGRANEARRWHAEALHILSSEEGSSTASLSEGEAARSLAHLAIAEHACGSLKEAEVSFRRAIQIRLDLAQRQSFAGRLELAMIQMHLAGNLVAQGQWPQAENELLTALDIHHSILADAPGYGIHRYLEAVARLGYLLVVQGRSDEAAEWYARLDALPIHDALAENALAWHLTTCRLSAFRDIDRAVALARRATETMPTNGHAWTTLGVALFEQNHFAESAEALQQAGALLEVGTERIWAYYRAMALWQVGEQEAARQLLAAAERHPAYVATWTSEVDEARLRATEMIRRDESLQTGAR